jgi:hypothetical protein
MNHDEAKKLMAAEAYILDDLQPEERAAFEEHFFDCTDCSADVVDAVTIADGLRTRSTTSNVIPIRHYQSRWAVAAAAAAVAMGLTYAYVPQIAGLWKHSPAPIGQTASVIAPEEAIDLEATRGAAAVHRVKGNRPVGIYFTIPPSDAPPSAYTCELLDASGHVVKSMDVRRDQAAEPVKLSLSAGTLRNGDYKLVIRGGDREIPFTVVEVP